MIFLTMFAQIASAAMWAPWKRETYRSGSEPPTKAAPAADKRGELCSLAIIFFKGWERGGVPMSVFTSLPQNSEWIFALTVVVLLVLVFASLIAFARRLSRLGKELERLTQEVDELQRLEQMRFLKGLREAKHKSPRDAEIDAPTLAP
jgi:hypothetical protein